MSDIGMLCLTMFDNIKCYEELLTISCVINTKGKNFHNYVMEKFNAFYNIYVLRRVLYIYNICKT